jgi:hypothetical protein
MSNVPGDDLAIVWLDNGTTAGLFTDAVAETIKTFPGIEPIRVRSGANISHSRNLAIEHFLTLNRQWALLVDADQTWTPANVERLFRVAFPGERPIVGALNFGWGAEGFYPTIYQLNDQGDLDRLENFYIGQTRPVDATGGGFLLVHRDVFVKIREKHSGAWPWFQETTSRSGVRRSEDITFCRRAADAGFKIVVDTGLHVGHIKSQVIDYRFYANWVEHHRLVVSGTPRSGTWYTFELIRRLGIGIGHETVYTTVDPKPWELRRGEVSWLSAPHLERFHGTVAHLVRNPLAVLNSLMGIGMFHQPEAHGAWTRYISENGIRLSGDPLKDAQRFIVGWNRMIEPHANRRIKVEDIGATELAWIAATMDAQPDRLTIQKALDTVPTNANSRTRADITWKATTPTFRKLAKDYGYDITD